MDEQARRIGTAGFFPLDLWPVSGSAPSLPQALNRRTAALPFPLAEPLALLLAGMLVLGLMWAAGRGLRNRSVRPVAVWLRGALALALSLAASLAVLWPAGLLPGAAEGGHFLPWLPAAGALCLAAGRRSRPASRARRSLTATAILLALGLAVAGAARTESTALPGDPDPAALEALCVRLIDVLNQELPEAVPADAILLQAPRVAGLPAATVKAARYPEWMRAWHLAGIFVPWTGEAIVDGTVCPALLPFTAVHELMHLAGIADEAAANRAAWSRCLEAGGSFALSARLWTLRYAAGQLAERRPASSARLEAGMTPALAALWRDCGGPISPGIAGRYGQMISTILYEKPADAE